MATLGLRIEPAPFGSGIAFRAEVEPRLIPLFLFKTGEAFTTQMEVYVREALAEGLAGWQVTDCIVTMTDCGYAAPNTSAADYRRLTQLVLMTALGASRHVGLRAALGPRPRDADVDRPWRPVGARAARRTGHRAVLGERADAGRRRSCRSPASGRCSTSCPGLSMGEGILESRPGGYQPIGTDPPRRERSTPSPLDRDAWLASLARRG